MVQCTYCSAILDLRFTFGYLTQNLDDFLFACRIDSDDVSIPAFRVDRAAGLGESKADADREEECAPSLAREATDKNHGNRSGNTGFTIQFLYKFRS